MPFQNIFNFCSEQKLSWMAMCRREGVSEEKSEWRSVWMERLNKPGVLVSININSAILVYVFRDPLRHKLLEPPQKNSSHVLCKSIANVHKFILFKTTAPSFAPLQSRKINFHSSYRHKKCGWWTSVYPGTCIYTGSRQCYVNLSRPNNCRHSHLRHRATKFKFLGQVLKYTRLRSSSNAGQLYNKRSRTSTNTLDHFSHDFSVSSLALHLHSHVPPPPSHNFWLHDPILH